MEALEYHIFKAVADPVELCSVLHLWGKFQAFALQQAFHGYVAISISHVLPCEASSEKTTGSIALGVRIKCRW